MSDGYRITDLEQALGDLEFAANQLAKGRPQAAYDAMIEAGQADQLLAFDRARRAARELLGVSVSDAEKAAPDEPERPQTPLTGAIG